MFPFGPPGAGMRASGSRFIAPTCVVLRENGSRHTKGNEKKIFNDPFCRVLAHDGVKTMNRMTQAKRIQTEFTYENKA
jgi:hypothetical protein